MKLTKINLSSVEKAVFFLTIFVGFWGVAILSKDLGAITLFPYRVFLLLLWFILITTFLFNKGNISLPIKPVRRYFWFLGFWVVYSLITLMWAIDSIAAIEDTIFLIMGFSVIFFTAYYCREEEDFKLLYGIWATVFMLFLLIGLWEHSTGNHLPVSGYFNETRSRYMYLPTGVYKNPNNYSSLLSISIPIGLSLLRYKKGYIFKLFGAVTSSVAIYLIVITGSRANILAIIFELAFLMLILTDLKGKLKFLVTFSCFLLVVVLMFPTVFNHLYSNLVFDLGSIISQVESMRGSMMIRINLVRNGFSFFLSTMGFGVGAGNAEYWMANFGSYFTEDIINPHNWWLEIFINYGIFIIAGYVMLYVSLILNLGGVWLSPKNISEKIISETLILSLVGFFPASLSPSSIMAFKPQWFLFAFAIAFLNYTRKREL